MQMWWEHVLRFSRRDQLSLPFVARATKLEVAVHNFDNHISPFHEWPRVPAVQARVQRSIPSGPEGRIADLEAAHEALLQQRDEAIARRGEAIAQCDEAIAQRDEAIAQRDEAIAQRDDAMAQRDALAVQFAAMEASVSWRITRPFRVVKASARRVSPRPGT
jgi:hypothetical protein